jgi:G3E family GTPase
MQDAKLVRNDRSRQGTAGSTADLTDTIELQNGCACCTLQDELFASFEQVLAMADKKGEPYSRIVLENSGVAEPQNIRDKFAEASANQRPVMDRIELDTLVTVVDSGTFIADYASRAPLASRPELGDGGNLRPVVDLLVEQIECADYIVLNKTDMLPGEDKLEQLRAIVTSLNPLATVVDCQQGKVPIDVVFGSLTHGVMARLNMEGQHRGAVAAAKASAKASDHHHDHHDHDHHHHKGEECHECNHHHHEHNHEADGKEHDGCHACEHDHHHHHEHNHEADGKEHDGCHACEHDHHHHHEHNHEADGKEHDGCHACEHDHHHHHHHHDEKEGHAETRAATRFGIRSFVYSRRIPFHPQRLKELVLKLLPVTHNQAIDGEAPSVNDSPIKTVLRSKGFMWMSNSHATAYYWSHAGQHFEIRDEGDWWAAVPDDEWPEDEGAKNAVFHDFDLASNYGDRRQEIVFIGVNMEEDKICSQLDSALLTEEEMAKYLDRWKGSPDPPHPDFEAMKKK